MKKLFADIPMYFLGGMLVAVSISCFAAPNGIAAGGFSGVGTLLNYLFSLPIGLTVLIMNIPVFIVGGRRFGSIFLIKTVIATALQSLLIDLAAFFLPHYSGDRLLAALFGGVLSGLGLALVFMRGATTGGVDIIAKLINLRYSHISIGRLIMILDAIVVAAAAVVYRNIESALYAVVMIYVQSKAIDAVLFGMDKGRVLLINSRKHEQIAQQIMDKMHRGVTVISAKGAYSNQNQPILLCAVRPYESAALRAIVREIDKTAFMVSLDAGEVVGEGFKEM